MTTKRITNRTKLGWDYNDDASHYDTIGIPYPDKPYHIGTIRQVSEAIDHDRNYAAAVSGGTYHTTAWFARNNGKWHRITSDSYEWLWMLDYFKHANVDLAS